MDNSLTKQSSVGGNVLAHHVATSRQIKPKPDEAGAFLLSKGWTCDKQGLFSSQFFDSELSKSFAIKAQREYDSIDARGVAYDYIRNRFGFGWTIIGFAIKGPRSPSDNFIVRKSVNLTPPDIDKTIAQLNLPARETPVDLDSLPREFPNRVFISRLEDEDFPRYFLTPTYEEFADIVLEIFLEMNEDDYAVSPSPSHKKPDVPEGTIFQNEHLRKALSDAWALYRSEVRRYREMDLIYKLLTGLKSSRDKWLSLDLLKKEIFASDYEFINLENCKR